MTSDFWALIDAQLAEARQATSAAQVCEIMRADPELTGRDGFFAGDDSLDDALHTAGWSYRWAHAPYHWCMEAPDGSTLTYVEGDLYIGDQAETPETDTPTSRHAAPDDSTDAADPPAGSAAQVATADFPSPPAAAAPTPPTASESASGSCAALPSPERSPRHGTR